MGLSVLNNAVVALLFAAALSAVGLLAPEITADVLESSPPRDTLFREIGMATGYGLLLGLDLLPTFAFWDVSLYSSSSASVSL